MSTRCQIGFYNAGETDLTKWDALLYRHCDGYPEGVLPDLQPFLMRFSKERGLEDIEYLAARTLVHLAGDNTSLTGFGICKKFHGDIEYFYAICSSGVKVYATPNADPKSWRLKMNLAIGQIPDEKMSENE